MNGLSLCAGIGGIDLGLKLAITKYRTVCYVEKEAFCQDILLARMADGVLDRAPIWDDLSTLDTARWRGRVDVIHGGYPCQPFSVAGKRDGESDPRHLWPAIRRIVGELRPAYCFFENVAGHLTLGFDVVARSLEKMGYGITAGLFTAAEIGAPHRRQRLFFLAKSTSEQMGSAGFAWQDPTLLAADTEDRITRGSRGIESSWWSTQRGADQPVSLGVDHGVPHRVDRLKSLGNAVVPDVVSLAWIHLMNNRGEK